MFKRNQYERDEDLEQSYYPPPFRTAESGETDYTPWCADSNKSNIDESASLIRRIRGQDCKAVPTATLASEINPATSRTQPSVFDPGFLQAYLNQNIGKKVRVEYLIGTNIVQDRVGTLEEVGISYVVLRDFSGSRVVTDLYSIKFVTIFDQPLAQTQMQAQ